MFAGAHLLMFGISDILVKRQEDSDVAPVCATGAEDQKNRIEWKVDGEMVSVASALHRTLASFR